MSLNRSVSLAALHLAEQFVTYVDERIGTVHAKTPLKVWAFVASDLAFAILHCVPHSRHTDELQTASEPGHQR
jgi:hypothetical protein